MVETLDVVAGSIVAGTGFTIYGFNTNQITPPPEFGRDGAMPRQQAPMIVGAWNVGWVWNS
jgi:hypothetical protein